MVLIPRLDLMPRLMNGDISIYICVCVCVCVGRGGTMVKVLCYKSEGRCFDPSWCHCNFSLTKSFRSHYGPGVDSASNGNEYQEHFLGGKGGRCVGLTILPTSCAVVMKSRNLNFLEPAGPLQAFNVTALPYTQGLWKRFERFKFGIFYVLIVKIRYNFTHK